MFQSGAFETYFVDTLGGKPGTFPTYRSYLKRIDELAGGLDELIQANGIEGARSWAKAQTEGPFQKYGSDARSVLNSYLGFFGGSAEGQDAAQPDGELPAPAAETTVFKLEKEMQKAVRTGLTQLEQGLLAIDDGIEVTTAVGRIDILARDTAGKLVVIELKAGNCPTGAIEQVLGYAQALADERGEPTRAILIAGAFSQRQIAASKRIAELALKTYSYSLSFTSAA